MENRITLRELKATLPSTTGHPVPTHKALRESADIVAKAVADGCRMEVYGNGFAVYSTHGHTTVFRMEWVGNVTYTSEVENWQSSVSVEDEDWSIGVMLYGEDRIEKKSRLRFEEHTVSLTDCWDKEDEDARFDAGVDVLGEIVSRDEFQRLMDVLTPRQRKVVRMHYIEQMTQEMVAVKLGVSQQMIAKILRSAKQAARKRL